MQHRFVLRTPLAAAMSLKARLEACRREFEAHAEPAQLAAVRASIRQLDESGIARNAVKAGEPAPRFSLPDTTGLVVSLADLLRRGPTVLSFFRGGWCSYCVLELRALAEAHPDIARLGASLVAISPYTDGTSASQDRHSNAAFPILNDRDGRVALRYRIGFTVPQQYRATYLELGLPKPMTIGPNAWRVPIPATYIIDASGVIILSYLDPDHTTRLEPAQIVRALDRLQADSRS